MAQLELIMDKPVQELNINSAELLAHIMTNTDLPARFADDECFSDRCFTAIHEYAGIWRTYECLGAHEEPFQVVVREYQGIFFVQAHEFNDRGFFLDVDMAVDAAEDIANNFSGSQ
jgi:hypothetical protein